MPRVTGTYRPITIDGAGVRAFLPHPLPPADPPLSLDGPLRDLHAEALAALGRLRIAGSMVPDPDWSLYGFVRKEAVISSQIEGTQATLRDVLKFEATQQTDRPDDVEEVCNYIEALRHARRQIASPTGLGLTTRLLCEAHELLLRGARGSDKQPGEMRTSQVWIGGPNPRFARFIPPPHKIVSDALGALESWIHEDDPLPPLVRAGLAHVQFETIHPFLDGNGRIGRLLVALLLEHWNLLDSPLLYLSLAFKRHRREYYERLSAVRLEGDWEGWTAYYLGCVLEAANDAIEAAQRIFALIGRDREVLLASSSVTISAVRLFDMLPRRPFVTMPLVCELLDTTKPTAGKALAILEEAGVLRETTGKQRDRIYVYHDYLQTLTQDTE
ncbi:MAG: Fic family protein [Phycisphaerales bacterium]|nr:Fic family protein [Phycisphaerales bacterium]